MSFNRRRMGLGMGLLLGLACIGWVSADDNKEKETPPAEAASELVSPEFVEHLDIDAASAALRDEDEDALVEIGEKLGAAERALQKPNPALSAMKFFEMAIGVAQRRHDVKALDKQASQIKATKVLNDASKKLLLTHIERAKKLAASPRKIDAGPGLKASEVSAESVALYKTFSDEIRNTQEYGIEEDLEPIADGVKQLSEFHPKQREHLVKLLGEARSAIKERGEVDPAVMKLASASRFVFGSDPGIRIYGPASVPANSKFVLVVVPVANKQGLKAGTLFASASSRAVTVAAKTPWQGKPTSVPVALAGQPGMTIGVKFSLAEKGPFATWTGRTVPGTGPKK